MKKIVHTDAAPAAIGPYSQAVISGAMMYTSGQIAIDVNTGYLNDATIAIETKQVMSNLKAVLEAGGADFDQVIKTTIFLKDMNDFQAVNEVYAQFFTAAFPARETVQVAKLPKDVRVEISMIAVVS